VDHRTVLAVIVGLLIVVLCGRRHHRWLLVRVSRSRGYRIGIITVEGWQVRSMHTSARRRSVALT